MRRRRHQILLSLSLSPLHGEKAQRNKKTLPFIFGGEGGGVKFIGCLRWFLIPYSNLSLPLPLLSPLLSRDFAGKERREEELSASPLDSKRESLWTQEHKRRGRLFIGPSLLLPLLLLSIYARFRLRAFVGRFPPPSFYAGHDFLYSPP